MNNEPVPQMNALMRLIRSRMSELGLTYEEAAKRGGFTTHTTLYQLATKKVHRQPPRPLTLERLAKAIDTPLDIVRAAASEAAGYKVYDMDNVQVPLRNAERVRTVAAAMGELDEEDVDMIATVTMQFLRKKRERDGDL